MDKQKAELSPAKPTEYCPQHGYPLPCAKCGTLNIAGSADVTLFAADKDGKLCDVLANKTTAKIDEGLREKIAKIIAEGWGFKESTTLAQIRVIDMEVADWFYKCADEILALIPAHNKDKGVKGWQETVMGVEQLGEVKYLDASCEPDTKELSPYHRRVLEDKAIAKRQAELSYKAGYEAGKQMCPEPDAVYHLGLKDGMRKVVEFLKEHGSCPECGIGVTTAEWQQFLKDNNLERGKE